MAAGNPIDLLIPGLFGPVPIQPEQVPHVPSLDRLLTRANQRPAPGGPDPVVVLLVHFGIEVGTDRDPPSAPFSRLADTGQLDSKGYWLHADPIHLRPDRDCLLLFDSRHIDLAREEADALVALFNGHFGADGLYLEAPEPDRWYLQADEPPRICTHSLSSVVGRSIDRFLPRGEEAGRWVAMLNEAQMLFHHSEVNQRREQAGRPAVNGVWPWGGGRLPGPRLLPDCGTVYAEHPLAAGLAKASGIDALPLPGGIDLVIGQPAAGKSLIFWDSLWPAVLDADVSEWVHELERLDAWLAGGIRNLQSAEIAVYPCNGVGFHATPGTQWRIWRRSLPFASRVELTQAGFAGDQVTERPSG